MAAGWKGLKATLAAISAMLGLASLTESSPFLISRMALTSSTRPLSQLLLTMRRLIPGPMGIFEVLETRFSTVTPGISFTSMKVRRHLFLQK